MQKILITYGTSEFQNSILRLQKEAKALNIFDRIILFRPKDLSPYIQSSPLMAFARGGGYWIWKPYIIWKTLNDYPNAIVVYVDGGCSLHTSSEWNEYFEQMKEYNTIVFHYRNDYDYKWDQSYTSNSTEIQYWTKKTTLQYFDSLFSNQTWRQFNKIFGGFIICKGGQNKFISEWLSISLIHPELIIDPIGNEITNQDKSFAQHRHDQCIITPLAYFTATNQPILILPETCESHHSTAAVSASRIKYVPQIKLKTRLIGIIKYIIGEKTYNFLHFYK
jgi:hypothetical protein